MSNQIEIGSGEDSHIDWAENFKVIDEIQLLLLDLESVEFPIEESTFHQVLNILELEPSDWQLFDGYFRAFDLLLNHPDISIESSLYDPDMPNSSMRQIIYVNESETKNLLQKLNEVRDIIKQYFDGNNVISLLKHAQSETILKKINQARLNKQRGLIEAEETFNKKRGRITYFSSISELSNSSIRRRHFSGTSKESKTLLLGIKSAPLHGMGAREKYPIRRRR